MHLASARGEGRLDVTEGALLGDYERVRGAVERVVAEHAEGEGPPHALVGTREVRHAIAQGEQRPRDASALDLPREPVAGRRARGECREARKERVGTLVAQQEGEQRLLALDETRGQRREDVLAKDVVRDERGHGTSVRRPSTVSLG